MRRLTFLILALILTSIAVARAQTAPGGLCFRDRPLPACSGWVFVDAGAYLAVGPSQANGTDYRTAFRTLADWGFMVSLGSRDAVGAGVFGYLDWGNGGFGNLGPEIRYRHWLGPASSWEAGVGIPLMVPGGQTAVPKVSGLLKWKPTTWLAVVARPELLRVTVYEPPHLKPGVSLGIEASRMPGLAVNLAAFALGVLWAATYHESN